MWSQGTLQIPFPCSNKQDTSDYNFVYIISRLKKLKLLNQPVMTPVEASLRIGVTVQTISLWVRNGILRAYKVGGRYYIPETSITDLVQDAAPQK